MEKTHLAWQPGDLHRFRQGGLNIVLDVNSGAVHLMDQIAWDLLEALEKEVGNIELASRAVSKDYSPSEISEAVLELLQLERDGALFSQDVLAQQGLLAASEGQGIKALCLHVAHDCNLRCSYCFAGTGPFGRDRSLMSVEVGRAAIDLLLEASGQRRSCEVDFFGGEPLLNFGVVRQLVAYGKEEAAKLGKTIRFTLTTNGLLLNNEVRQFLNQEGLQVVLSLDGRPEVHDRHRPFPGGQGSYQPTLQNIRDFVASRSGRDYYIRGTFTAHNPDFSRDVLHLADLGFEHISVEPVVAGPEEDYALDRVDPAALEKEYEVLAEACLAKKRQGQPINFFHFNLDLMKGPCLPRRLAGCGAGNEYLAVTPEGSLYPCHQFVGQEQFYMGDVKRGITNKPLRNMFQKLNVYTRPHCRSCWARFYCSGGCHANNFSHGGALEEIYVLGCRLQKKRLECAIYLQVRELAGEPIA
ncbi:MAG: thioether cross-link-forming SCIFF peptide maturase [Bacillota bacterium]